MVYSEIGVKDSVENIFAPIVIWGIDRTNTELIKTKSQEYRPCLSRFKATFASNVFIDEYAFIYECIMRLDMPVLTMEQLRTVVYNNVDGILNGQYISEDLYKIYSNNQILSDEEKVSVFIAILEETVNRLSNKVVTEDEFITATKVYTQWFEKEYYSETVQNMALIMSEAGLKVKKSRGRGRTYKGVKDAEMYYIERKNTLDAMREGRVSYEKRDTEWLEEERKDSKKEEVILDTGLKEIDDVIGGFERGQMIEFLGPTKGGKTTISAYMVERALSKGLNVAVWTAEGVPKDWDVKIQPLIVRRFGTEGNSGDTSMAMSISSKEVEKGVYTSEAHRKAIETAKQILATDPNRGRLSYINSVLAVENMEQVLDEHYREVNPFDVLVVDSPLNARPNTMSYRETVLDCFRNLKTYVSRVMYKSAVCIVTAQLKQEVINALRMNPEADLDITAGAESAETIRTPDEVIGLFSSKEERDNGQMKLYHVASRHSSNFQNFYAGCDLSCAYFYSNPELNE